MRLPPPTHDYSSVAVGPVARGFTARGAYDRCLQCGRAWLARDYRSDYSRRDGLLVTLPRLRIRLHAAKSQIYHAVRAWIRGRPLAEIQRRAGYRTMHDLRVELGRVGLLGADRHRIFVPATER